MVPRSRACSRARRELARRLDARHRAADRSAFAFAPGQFNMLYVFGVGEVAIRISGDPAEPETLVHTIRAVGKVSGALTPAQARRYARPARAVRHRLAGGGGRRPRRGGRRRRARPRAAAAGALSPARRARALRPDRPAVRHAQPGRHPVPPRARALARGASTSRSRSPSTTPTPDWHGHVGVVTTLIPRAAFDPRQHHRDGLRAGDDDALRRRRRWRDAGRRRRGDLPVDGAQHEMRHRPLRPLPVRPATSSARTGRCCATTSFATGSRAEGDLTWRARANPSSPSGSSPPATAASSRLLDCEDELLAVAGAVEIAYFPEATRGVVKGPYDLSLVEGSITTPHDAERIQEVRRQSKTLITIGACATAGGIQALRNFADVREFTAIVYARPGLHRDARHLDADRRACAGRFRAARLPDQQAPAGRGDHRLPRRPQAGDAGAQRLRRVQAEGQCLRDGRARHALPRAGDPCRLRRALPVLQPRLLRLLRPDGDARTPPSLSRRARRARHGRSARCSRVYRTFNADAEPFRKESERHGA